MSNGHVRTVETVHNSSFRFARKISEGNFGRKIPQLLVPSSLAEYEEKAIIEDKGLGTVNN